MELFGKSFHDFVFLAPFSFCVGKISKLGDLVCNDDDYDDEKFFSFFFTWVGIMGSGYGKGCFFNGRTAMYQAMPPHRQTDRQTDTAKIGRAFGALGFAVWVSSILLLTRTTTSSSSYYPHLGAHPGFLAFQIHINQLLSLPP